MAGSRCVVASAKAAFFKHGPAQGYGSDLELEKGRRVTFISKNSGYFHVKLDSGEEGYIADGQLAALPREIPAVPKLVNTYSMASPVLPIVGLDPLPDGGLFGATGAPSDPGDVASESDPEAGSAASTPLPLPNH